MSALKFPQTLWFSLVFLVGPQAWMNPTIQVSGLALNSWQSSAGGSHTKEHISYTTMLIKPQMDPQHGPAILLPFSDLSTLFLKISFKFFSPCNPLI